MMRIQNSLPGPIMRVRLSHEYLWLYKDESIKTVEEIWKPFTEGCLYCHF